MANAIPGPKQLIAYLYDLRLFIGIVVVLFVLSGAVGYFIPQASPATSQTLIAGLQEKAKSLTGQSPLLMMLGIFSNNATGALMAMLFGVLAGVFPLFFVVTNGMIIGIMLEMMVVKLGVVGGTAVFLVGILPHGIFELPAVLISTAIGLKLGYAALRSLIKRDGSIVSELKSALLIFFFWILPTLFIAAIVETFVTGALLAHFFNMPLLK